MNISTRMMLSYVAAGLVLFGTYGVYTMRAEKRDLKQVLQQNTILLGNSVRVAVENALRDGQLADISEMVEKLGKPYEDVNLIIYDADGMPISTSMEAQASSRLMHDTAELIGTKRDVDIHVLPSVSGDATDLVIFFPLIDDDNEYLGHLAVIRSLAGMERDLQTTLGGILVLIAVFVTLTTAVGYIIGLVYVHRPLGKLITAIGDIRSGSLLTKIDVGHRDEIGVLAREFNAMIEELFAARNELEMREGERRELLLSLQRADKLVTVGQLSAGLAHEIGSPLQVLSGRARDMLSAAHDPAEVKRNAEIMISQTDRIVLIVEQLLHFSRKRIAHMQAIDLAVPVQQVVDLLQFEARRRNVRLSTNLEQSLPRVYADADQIQQVVANLIINAFDATPHDGKIDISLERVSMKDPDGTLRAALALAVTDTGCGMTSEVQQKVFEPFFTTRSDQGGTGLGLAIVRSIVNNHGGNINLESHVGLGTRFVVVLPAVE